MCKLRLVASPCHCPKFLRYYTTFCWCGGWEKKRPSVLCATFDRIAFDLIFRRLTHPQINYLTFLGSPLSLVFQKLMFSPTPTPKKGGRNHRFWKTGGNLENFLVVVPIMFLRTFLAPAALHPLLWFPPKINTNKICECVGALVVSGLVCVCVRW